MKDLVCGSSRKCYCHSCGGKKKFQGSFKKTKSVHSLQYKSHRCTLSPSYTGHTWSAQRPRHYIHKTWSTHGHWLCKENGYKPKPVPQTCTGSAIAPPIEVYSSHNIFTISNYGSHEDIGTSTSVPLPFQDSQDPEHNSSQFQESQDPDDDSITQQSSKALVLAPLWLSGFWLDWNNFKLSPNQSSR